MTAGRGTANRPHGWLASRHGHVILPPGSVHRPHGWLTFPHGRRFGIEDAQQTAPDLTTIQPVINAIVSGNHVSVKWGWGGNSAYLDLCELQVDRGDGKGFGLLAFDTTPGYTDTQTFPATPAIWTYRAIYRVGDNQVGVWSLPVSVTVPA